MLTRALLVALLWSIPGQLRAQEADSGSLYGFLGGFRIGSPEKFAWSVMSVQTIWVGELGDTPPRGASRFGWFGTREATPAALIAVGLQGEVGVSGARAGVALIGCCSGPLSMGFQTRAGFIWTWGSPWTVEGGQSFAGGDVRVNVFPWLVLSQGFYWRLSGSREPSEAVLFGVGVGW